MRIQIAALITLVLTLATGMAPPLTITDKNAGQTMRISVGQAFEVRLPANPSTGYAWSAGVLGRGPLVESRPATYQRPASSLLGSSGTEVFSYRAVAPGAANLSFSYSRSWEHTAPAKHLAVAVVVR
jgi:inhibitor of cysteine peptidase